MIGKEFIESTKYQYIKTTGHSEKKLAPLIQLPYNPEDMIINLPDPDFFDEQQVNFLEMIELRTTIRHYSDKSMSLKDLSYLLWCTQGVKMVVEKGSLRNVPSAGARHAFETYLLVNNVEGLEKGIYRFLAIEHKLLAIKVDESLLDEAIPAFLNQKTIANAAVTFIWVAVAERMVWRFGERGYRYLLLDAGHICQNLYLAGQNVNCGTCAIAAFDDDAVNRFLNLDGEELFVVYAATVGKY